MGIHFIIYKFDNNSTTDVGYIENNSVVYLIFICYLITLNKIIIDILNIDVCTFVKTQHSITIY